MIPTQTGGDSPFAETNLILDESALFEIPSLVFGKSETERSEGIKLGGVGDVIDEGFVDMRGVHFDAAFPFLAAVMDGNGGFDIEFAEAAVLESDDGGGERVGVQELRIVASHGAKIGEDVGGKGVLVKGETESFKDGTVLALRGGLLDEFVGDFETRNAVADEEADDSGHAFRNGIVVFVTCALLTVAARFLLG